MGPQVLWPDHCVQGTPGAEISRDLDIVNAQLVIRRGYNAGIDSYSGFKEADRHADQSKERQRAGIHMTAPAFACTATTASPP